jgi:hypothetical protein
MSINKSDTYCHLTNPSIGVIREIRGQYIEA